MKNLQLDAVSKIVRGETHLYNLSLTLQPGLNVLLGPTTAGKTSLMRLMAGLDQPSSGRVLADGEDITQRSVKTRDVAFVYQQFINYPSLTVFENIASPLRVRSQLNRAEIKEKVEHTAETMRIAPLLNRLPAELSGGQQQRTAIARALIKESPLLFLDEPLVNLDYKLREELRAEMQNIFATRSAIVVYSTTEPVEALMLGGTTFVLDQGHLLQQGPTLEVYHRPSSLRVGQVFSDPPMNILPGHVAGQELVIAEQFHTSAATLEPQPPNGDCQVGVRANHVTLTATSPQDIRMQLVVKLAEITGSATFVHVGTALESDFHLVVHLEGVHQYNRGETITLYLNPQRLYLFTPAGSLLVTPRAVTTQFGSVQGGD